MSRFSLVFLSALFCVTATARAHDVQIVQAPITQSAPYALPYPPRGPYPYVRPRHRSILAFGLRGTWSGALAGLGASYLAARDSGDAWRAVGLSVSIGALSGAALGLSLGVFDQLDFPAAYYISRDLSYGTLFGALIGALGGVIVTIGNGDAEAILLGAAAGSLGGLGLGMLTGILEGQYRARRDPFRLGSRFHMTIGQVAPETRTWGARVQGRF
jgi:hypothetical protein